MLLALAVILCVPTLLGWLGVSQLGKLIDRLKPPKWVGATVGFAYFIAALGNVLLIPAAAICTLLLWRASGSSPTAKATAAIALGLAGIGWMRIARTKW